MQRQRLSHRPTRRPASASIIASGSHIQTKQRESLSSGLVIVGMQTKLGTVLILIFIGVAASIHHTHHHTRHPWLRRQWPLLFGAPIVTLSLPGFERISIAAPIGRWDCLAERFELVSY